MPDAPEAPSPADGKNFLMKKVGPLPLVVWVGGGGLAVGGYLWYRNRKEAAAGASTATAAAAAVPTAATSQELEAAGYDQSSQGPFWGGDPGVSGSAPSTTALPPAVAVPATPTAVVTPTPTAAAKAPASTMSNAAPTKVVPKYITVTPWPTLTSTLSGISSKVGVPLARIEALNPQIKNPNLIHAGESVRYA
jgi:LysM repeat protein